LDACSAAIGCNRQEGFGLVSAVFELAVASDKQAFNPVKGLRLAKPSGNQKSRVPFDADDLTRLFCSCFTEGVWPLGRTGAKR